MKPFNEATGYDTINSFIESAFHPKMAGLSITFAGILGSISYYVENFLGFDPIIGIVMVALFGVELFTGIKASKVEGNKFSSKKFGRGFLKMGVYLIMIGLAHLLAKNVDIKPLFGWEFNYYEWMHYAFFNFVIIQLFISNLENFKRLGWDDFLPILKKLTKFVEKENKEVLE